VDKNISVVIFAVCQKENKQMSKTGDTPLMQQHRAIKQKYPDAILLFRVGDFYETFEQDAVIASRVLGITLTKRNNGAAESSALAGFPHHSLDTYLHKLVKAGHRVAICDQLEDPKTAKGIIKRGVTELVTPGVATSDKLLEQNSNNFLCGIHFDPIQNGIALLDISTGEFFVAAGNQEYTEKLLQTFKPAEVVFQRSQQKPFKETYGNRFYTYALESWVFDEVYAREIILKHFGTHSLKGFGIEDMTPAIIAAGAIFHYLKDTEHPHLQHITALQRLDKEDYVWMDQFTIRNLELLQTGIENGDSLLKTLDNTVSPMGGRLLRRWVILPLIDPIKINERLDLTDFFIREADLRNQITQLIKQCGDVERLAGKIPLKKINPREVKQIAKGLEQIATLKSIGLKATNSYLKRLSDTLHPCELIRDRILEELVDLPPINTQKGGVIAPGVHHELDELKMIASNGKEYLLEMQQREAEKTGISSLKIAFNNVFGYYLEVTHAHKSKIPADWIRKQTLTNAERYITPELKDYEEKIIGAEDKIIRIETELFDKLLNDLQDYISAMQVNGNILAIMDCLACFANNAVLYNYCRPILHDGDTLDIKDARHPVIERHLPPEQSYIANDIYLDRQEQQIVILTGPNMSGKSAILRQTALITLLAHAGSFVPATAASIPLTDKIFTRVGASDNLSGGESTFMVEMNETASIINNISSRSLILLDEIGRGTSTYDGISIAWSIVEHLNSSAGKPLTLFATHYHELNDLESKLEGVKNFHVTHKESNNKIIFLRKLAQGGSKHSFGIHVAKMAGMPPALIKRANQILSKLEGKHKNEDISQTMKSMSSPQVQLSIFDTHTETFQEIRQLLEDFDINKLTPVEALFKLNEIKQKLG
jgi:DNA mismatch repair protein MutS